MRAPSTWKKLASVIAAVRRSARSRPLRLKPSPVKEERSTVFACSRQSLKSGAEMEALAEGPHEQADHPEHRHRDEEQDEVAPQIREWKVRKERSRDRVQERLGQRAEQAEPGEDDVVRA